MRKNKFIFILLLLFGMLFFHTGDSFAVETATPEETAPVAQAQSLDEAVNDAINNSLEEIKTPVVEDIKEMTPNANEQVRKEVLNDTNDNLKFTLKKFAYAMAGVLVSSIIIFIILTLMNKFNATGGMLPVSNKEEESPAKGGIDITNKENDALKIFFEKTK